MREIDIGEEGSVIVLLMFAIPFMIAAMAMVISLGQVTMARMRVQIAADRASYAAAASMADSMNRVAAENRSIHDAFKTIDAEYKRSSQDNEEGVRQSYERYEERRVVAEDNISQILGSMGARARAIAENLGAANAPRAEFQVKVVDRVELAPDIEPELQNLELNYQYVSGDTFVDPRSVEGGSKVGLSYLMKRAAGMPDAAITVDATAAVRPLILSQLLGGDTIVRASSAAQVFGGSVKEYALAEDDDRSSDHLYRAVNIPRWLIEEGR